MGHGYVQQIWLGENLVDTWNPYKDPSKTGVNKITRKFTDNGPVTDDLFTTDAITCNIGSTNNMPAGATAEVAAGAVVKFMWTEWKSDHPGPSMPSWYVFMALYHHDLETDYLGGLQS